MVEHIRRTVSGYASLSRAELVAEVYAGLKAGRVFPGDIMAYYRELGGIKP
jgi:hypothetical protein